MEDLDLDSLSDITKSVMEVTEIPRRFVRAVSSPHKKCDRCWHYREDVGVDSAHPTICGRCVSNLFGAGEPRKYA